MKNYIITPLKNIVLHSRLIVELYVLMAFFLALLLSNSKIDLTVFISMCSWFLLSTGSTLFNDYYDRDKGVLLGLDHPPKIKKYILSASIIAKAVGFILSILYLPIVFSAIYIFGILASIAYSHKEIRVKAMARTSVLFSFLSGAATYFVAIIIIFRENYFAILNNFYIHLGGLLASAFFLSSFHIMTQIHQKKEDADRGDKTLTVIYGREKALLVGLIFYTISTIIIAIIFLASLSKIIGIIFIIYSIITILFIIKWMKYFSAREDKKNMQIITRFSLNVVFIFLIIIYFYLVYFNRN